MKGVLLAWITALTLSTVNSFRSGDGLPVPGVLVGDSVIMAILALISEVAPTPAALAAWGFIIAQIIANPSILPTAPAKTTSVPTPAAA
jgi:hypothetical protein